MGAFTGAPDLGDAGWISIPLKTSRRDSRGAARLAAASLASSRTASAVGSRASSRSVRSRSSAASSTTRSSDLRERGRASPAHDVVAFERADAVGCRRRRHRGGDGGSRGDRRSPVRGGRGAPDRPASRDGRRRRRGGSARPSSRSTRTRPSRALRAAAAGGSSRREPPGSHGERTRVAVPLVSGRRSVGVLELAWDGARDPRRRRSRLPADGREPRCAGARPRAPLRVGAVDRGDAPAQRPSGRAPAHGRRPDRGALPARDAGRRRRRRLVRRRRALRTTGSGSSSATSSARASTRQRAWGSYETRCARSPWSG